MSKHLKQDILSAMEDHLFCVGGQPSLNDLIKRLRRGDCNIRQHLKQLENEGYLIRSLNQWRRDSYEVVSFKYTGARE